MLVNRHNTVQGFTLVEMAIVMGVSGALLTGIWVAYDHYAKAAAVNDATRQILKTVQNIREYYSGVNGIPNACNNADITPQIRTIGAFPLEVVQAGGAIRTSVGPMQIRDVTGAACVAGTLYGTFAVSLTGVRQEHCIKLLFSGINYQDSTLGITGVMGRAITCNGGICGPGGARITLPQAIAWCAPIGTVSWEFRVRN